MKVPNGEKVFHIIVKAKFFYITSGFIIVDNNFIFPNRDSIPLNSQTFLSFSICGCVVQKGNKVLNIWKFKIIKKWIYMACARIPLSLFCFSLPADATNY